jgi:hypothetical protein
MTPRWNVYGLGVSLCLASFTLSSLAHAQTPDAATSPGEPDADKAAEPSGAATEEATPEESPTSKAEPVAQPKAEAKTPATGAAPPNDSASTPGISVEILPGSGYPEPRVRGLKLGSLGLTMHGLQWPYLPAEPGQSRLRLALSGSIWVDTAYARLESGTPDTFANQKRWTNQGRAVLRATPTYSTDTGWFAQGQIEFVANGDQTLASSNDIGGVDDVYARVGKWKVFDITVGRFQGWEVYHYGMGLDLNTFERRGAEGQNQSAAAPQIYGVDTFWDRPNGGAGNYAGHIYFTDYLRLELLGQIGTRSGANTMGFRPVGILDLGFVKAKVGFEYGEATAQADNLKNKTTRNGVGGALQFVFNPYIEGGVNGAVGYVDSLNNEGLRNDRASTTTTSIGGFLNGRVYGPLIIGLGVNQTHFESLDKNGQMGSPNFGKPNSLNHFQAFAAIQYTFFDRVLVKFVGSRASFEFQDFVQEPPHPFTNGMWGGRLRVMYLF